MSEAELTNLTIQSASAVLQIVALYFTIVSAYVAALYYFLSRSPFVMKAMAFIFMSGALGFLGLTSIAIERTTTGVVTALHVLPNRIAAPAPTPIYLGVDSLIEGRIELGILAGWGMAVGIYLCLFYLTFLHRWRER
jgi:hypothetical protein